MAAVLEHGWMSDVTLLVGAARYNVHKVLLCASSDVFQVSLTRRRALALTRLVAGGRSGDTHPSRLATETTDTDSVVGNEPGGW